MSMSHTSLRLLKLRVLSHKPLRMALQPRHRFKKSDVSLLYEQFMLQRQRLHERRYSHSVHSSFTRRKFCTYATFLGSPVPPIKKVIRRMTSDCDVCEVDLAIQMSFLYAALLHQRFENIALIPRIQHCCGHVGETSTRFLLSPVLVIAALGGIFIR